jgi:hypothetical protein
MLSVDLPGIEELREQAETVRVMRWAPYDASLAFYVDTEASRPSTLRKDPNRNGPVIETYAPGPDGGYGLLLWVDLEGWLSSLEFYPYGDEWPEELPPPSAFDPPERYRPKT